MIYRSNLRCPDLSPNFEHLHVRPMPHAFGHSVPSDWADKRADDPQFGIYKNCGMWTHDEAAILFQVAKQIGGFWLDIGAHTGWTSAHIDAGVKLHPDHGKKGFNNAPKVVPVDPMFRVDEFAQRFRNNTGFPFDRLAAQTSSEYFAVHDNGGDCFDGICVDGDHEPGEPLKDAKNAYRHLEPTAVMLFHDFIGRPVREAVEWVRNQGMKCRVYYTPHMIALCWRGAFVPPDHTPDQQLIRQLTPHLVAMTDFDFGRCE